MARPLAKAKELFTGAKESFGGRAKPLRIGSEAPDFTAKSTAYDTDAQTLPEYDFHFHSYIHKKWAVLFSHPCNFTPVCTTEIAAFAEKQDEFAKRDTRLIGLSVSGVENHKEWISDIHSNRVTTRRINFPVVADEHGVVARLYDMLDNEETPTNEDITECKPRLHTIRSVFIINTDKKIRAILSYPMETGRNIDEIIRVIDSLQARAEHGHHIVTPANWQPGEDVLFRQDDPKKFSGRRSDVEWRYNLPYMKFRPLPKDQLQVYRQEPLRVPFPELGIPTPTGATPTGAEPTGAEPTAAPSVPSTSGTSS